MPPKITAADRILVSAYAEAALRIERLLQSSDVRQSAILLGRVDSILAELRDISQRYVGTDLPEHFVKGSNEAIAKLTSLSSFGDIDTSFGPLHRETIQRIADGAADSFGNAVVSLRKSVELKISQAEKKRVVTELIAANVEGSDTTKAVKEALDDIGIIGVRAGERTLNLEHYASLVANTVLADAYNMGAATRYIANGVEYGRRIERADAPDKLCQWMRDKIVWLGEPRFVGALHPNCFGAIVPYFGDTSQAIRSLDDPRVPEYVRKALSRRL